MAHILVTGGAGFIGSHLVDALVGAGHRVRVLDALVPQVHGPGSSWPVWLAADAERLEGDVRDPAIWARALDRIDVVYHLAAEVGVGQSMYRIAHYMDANTLGTARLLEAMTGGDCTVRKLVVASSMSLYGEGAYQSASGELVFPSERSVEALSRQAWDSFAPDVEGPLTPVATAEDKPLRPTSIYAISKRDQEEMCLTVGRAYGIPTVALRFFNVYGPRQALSNPYTGAVAIFSARLLNGRPPLIFEDGRQARDFVHVSDIVQGLCLAMDATAADYRTINLGTGRATSILDVARTLSASLGVSIEPEVAGRFRAGDIRACYADISRARALLGYDPRVTLEEGIEGLIAWLIGREAIDRVEQATRELERRGLTR